MTTTLQRDGGERAHTASTMIILRTGEGRLSRFEKLIDPEIKEIVENKLIPWRNEILGNP